MDGWAGGRASGREDGEARGKTGLENAGNPHRRGRSWARGQLLHVAEDEHAYGAQPLLRQLCLRCKKDRRLRQKRPALKAKETY